MDIDRLKFATKASLSLVVVTIVSFWYGLGGLSSALVAIMVIASYGSLGDSIRKGLLRIAGTILGAILGVSLMAIFPQSRELYLLYLSIFVTLSFYLSHAYRGDNTIFMLIGLMMMSIFQDGNIENGFLYGVEKSCATIFAIALYTLIGIYIFPDKKSSNTIDAILSLTKKQIELFEAYISKDKNIQSQWRELMDIEGRLKATRFDKNEDELSQEFDSSSWQSIISHNQKIDNLLILISQNHSDNKVESREYILDYDRVIRDIETLFNSIERGWIEREEIEIPQEYKIEYNSEMLKRLSHLQRAYIITLSRHLSQLHRELIALAEKINLSISPYPTIFDEEDRVETSSFLWFDIDDMKSSLLTFLIFWASTLIWIEFNPPGGFMLVILATTLSLYTTFSPLKPTTIALGFTISFIFATVSYIFILPNLHYSWELSIFIFIYGMIGFYIMPSSLTVIFLLGIATLNITNEMSYYFDIFLLILLIFYLFLSILLVAYYIPFSTRAEDMFLSLKRRFFNISKATILSKRAIIHSSNHIIPTAKKMQMWGGVIDSRYFEIDKRELIEFAIECERLGYLLLILENRRAYSSIDSMLGERLRDIYPQDYIDDKLSYLAKGLHNLEDTEDLIYKAERTLTKILEDIDISNYKKEEIATLYESINLRENIWKTLLKIETLSKKIEFQKLKIGRF